MIAYLFWNRPAQVQGYEEGLVEFHRRLAGLEVPGLVASATYRVAGLPWMPGPAYEDWYLVERWADLEVLNEAAVSPPIRAAHDRPALASASGAGAVYRVISGRPDLAEPVVTWLAKPREVRYPDYYSSLPPTACLLRRQMVLGPAPEFCAFGGVAGGIEVERELVFRSGGGSGPGQ